MFANSSSYRYHCDYLNMSGGSSSNNNNNYNYNNYDPIHHHGRQGQYNSPETDEFPDDQSNFDNFPDLSMLDEWLDSDGAPLVGQESAPPSQVYGSLAANEEAVDESGGSGSQVGGGHVSSE